MKPITISKFKGLWSRGPVDNCPPDHCTDIVNFINNGDGVQSRGDSTVYADFLASNWVRKMVLYKPNPPYTGTNVPRILALTASGSIFDVLISTTVPIYSNAQMTDFGYANFFGRGYISASDGRVGISGANVQVYEGSGVTRTAAGTAPTTGLNASISATASTKIGVGTYFFSYAFETSSGFITKPATYAYVDSFGGFTITLNSIDTGPANTTARWIICTKATAFRADMGTPPDPQIAQYLPTFFAHRIPNNTDTSIGSLDFFDESLVDSADYLNTLLTTIPAGVGLGDYKGRLISYGEYADPTLIRISQIGEPEAISSTSGFLISDPTDGVGIRAAVDFRGVLYFFKRNRSFMTEDNGDYPSTWNIIEFDKAYGTEQGGIARILDAKGASSSGFVIATVGGLYYYNGVFSEPELSWKIADLWNSIDANTFYKIRVTDDPILRRLYICLPVGTAQNNILLIGDYSEGMSANSIRWFKWSYSELGVSPIGDVADVLNYTDYTANSPTQITRFAVGTKIRTYSNAYDIIASAAVSLVMGPVRFSDGVSHFNRIRLRLSGDATVGLSMLGLDSVISSSAGSVVLANDSPGREYSQLTNLVSEQGRLSISCGQFTKLKITSVTIEGSPLWDERPR